ncbi:MAG: hypothetical protein ACRC4L_01330 [Mycoplasma sp.]
MKLFELAEIKQGSIYTRIKQKDDEIDKDAKNIDTISMQEVNYTLGKIRKYEYITSMISRSEEKNLILTKLNDVLIGLTMQKAIVVNPERVNNLVLSNFALIRINDTNLLDPNYLAWCFNENKEFIKKIIQAKQGSSAVVGLTVQMIRDFEIKLPSIDKQIKIGTIYNLSLRKNKIDDELSILKSKIVQALTEKIYKGA